MVAGSAIAGLAAFFGAPVSHADTKDASQWLAQVIFDWNNTVVPEFQDYKTGITDFHQENGLFSGQYGQLSTLTSLTGQIEQAESYLQDMGNSLPSANQYGTALDSDLNKLDAAELKLGNTLLGYSDPTYLDSLSGLPGGPNYVDAIMMAYISGPIFAIISDEISVVTDESYANPNAVWGLCPMGCFGTEASDYSSFVNVVEAQAADYIVYIGVMEAYSFLAGVDMDIESPDLDFPE